MPVNLNVLDQIYSCKVKGKIYRLIYEMNKNVRIKIKTPVGMTQSEDVGPLVTQGSVEAATLSSVSLGNGVNDAFVQSDVEVVYGKITLGPQIFMDDIARLAENRASAQYANHLMEKVIGSKGLEFNLDKSSYLIMGNKANRRKLKAQTITSPIQLCNENMKEVKVLRYLGDCISYNIEESIHQTVLRRVAIAKLSVYEIRAVIEDTRSEKLGALGVAFDIWEAAIVPMLIHNCESWFGMAKKTIKILDDLFHKFCQSIFRVGTGCPIVNYYWQSGSLTFTNIILAKQLNFIHHLANLPQDALARTIFDESVNLKLPGLYQQCERYLNEMGIIDLQVITKGQMKSKVKKFIRNKTRSELLVKSQNYKKLDFHKLSRESLERKP